MATYDTLAALQAGIASRIYTNTGKLITGDVMQQMLTDQSASIWDFATDSVNAGNVNTPWLKPYASKKGYGNYDLEAVYGLNTGNGSMMLGQLYTLADAKTKFEAVFHWYQTPDPGPALTDEQMMTMRHVTACHNEAVLQGYDQGTWGTGRIQSGNNIRWPYGVYHHNASMIFDIGQYIGNGTAAVYMDRSGGTVHVLDRENWLEDPAQCHVLRDSLGTGPWNLFSYLEGPFIDQARFEGLCNHKAHDPSYDSSGISFRGPGENAMIGCVKINGFNGDGLRLVASTPVYVHYLSTFSNALGGVGLLAGALSTYNFGTISADDNTCIFRVRDYLDQRSGGHVNVGFIKLETDTTERMVDNNAGVPTFYRGQIICDADGFTGPNANEGSNLNLVIGNCTVTAQNSRLHSMCAVRGFQDGLPPGYVGIGRKARIKINGTYHFAIDNFVQDIGAQLQWPLDGDFLISGFTWSAITGVLSRDEADGAPPPSEVQTATQRLGVKTTEPTWATVPPFDPTFGGTISPDRPFGDTEYIACGVVPSQISVGETAQCSAVPIDVSYRINTDAVPVWACSGPATIDPATGVVTATGVGLVTITVTVAGTLYRGGTTYLNVVE